MKRLIVCFVLTFLMVLPMSLYSRILPEGSTVYSYSSVKYRSYTVGYLNIHQSKGWVTVVLSIEQVINYDENKNMVREYRGSIRSSQLKSVTTIYLKEIGAKGPALKHRIIFHDNNALSLHFRKQTLKFKKKDILDGIFQGEFGYYYQKKEGLIFASTEQASREYIRAGVKRGKTVLSYYNRKNTNPVYLKVLSWAIRKNPVVDNTYPNDHFSTFVKAQFPSGQIVEIEYDIERHPISWGGARLYRQGQKTLRLWHLEQIENYSYTRRNGQKEFLLGFRQLASTEEYVYISPEYPNGLYFKYPGKGYIQSYDGKIKLLVQLEKVKNQWNMIITDDRGRKKRFKSLYQ